MVQCCIGYKMCLHVLSVVGNKRDDNGMYSLALVIPRKWDIHQGFGSSGRYLCFGNSILSWSPDDSVFTFGIGVERSI